MASSTAIRLEVRGLGRKAISELTSKAKRLGMTPERYIRQLVQDDLALGPQGKVDDA